MGFKATIKMENSAMMDADDIAEAIVGALPSMNGAKKKGTFSNRRGETVGSWEITEGPEVVLEVGADDWTDAEVREHRVGSCGHDVFDDDGDGIWTCTRADNHPGAHVAGDGSSILGYYEAA